jgi:8-oxo-dGTP diphosphatase
VPASADQDLARPNLVDLAYQLGYFGAYRLVRLYWKARRPLTHGALVALWCEGRVLLVRNSYVGYYSAPGGYLRPGETARDAAVRELREEVGVVVDPARLVQSVEVTHDWEGRRDHVVVFSLEVTERPVVHVDYREVVEAFWFEPHEVARSEVFPPLKQAIAEHAQTRA